MQGESDMDKAKAARQMEAKAAAEEQGADGARLQPEDLDFTVLGTECTRIDGAQNRAITLHQLERLGVFIRSHADEEGQMQWIDRADPQYSETAGQQLSAKRINLYQV